MSAAKIDRRDLLGRKKSAYSLRHTFITRARKDGARFDVVKQNVGHSVKKELGVTTDYFGGYEVDEIYNLLSHVAYPALEDVPTYNEWANNLIGAITKLE